MMYPPQFAYVSNGDALVAVPINGTKDLAHLQSMKGNQPALLAWLRDQKENLDGIQVRDIISFEVELYDDPDLAVSVGNPTVELWRE